MSALDPVQLAALEFARDKRGVGWFLEQGLGKTLCALAEFSWYSQLDEADRMIVICPNSFKRGWVDEISKHSFQFADHVFRSSKKEDAATFLARGHNRPPILILNYEAFRMPAVLTAICKWASKGRTYLAIDESIQIKSYKAAQTKAALKLAPLCAFVRILSGKPMTQGPHDLWGQLRAIGLFPYQNFISFRGTFCQMGGYMMKDVIAAKNEKLLAAAMAPWVFQAKKKDWLPNLPRKDSTIRDYAMSTEQLRQYKSMEEELLLAIENDYVTVDVAIAKYEKLAQIQTGFIYDAMGTIHRELVRPSENPRLTLTKQLLDEEIEGKVCVVYRHRPVFDLLLKALTEYDSAWIKGSMKPDEVEEQKARFNTDPHCRVILLQAEASKYGHTLLGGPGPDDKCRTMVFFENSYSADTRDQVEDRIHRRGQTGESVLYIDLSGSDLDRQIVKALQQNATNFIVQRLKT